LGGDGWNQQKLEVARLRERWRKSEVDHAPDALALVHEVKGLVDLGEGKLKGDI